MKRRLVIISILCIFAFWHIDCASVRTSSGESLRSADRWTPTGKASSRALGLGPMAPTAIWTDGQSREINNSIPLNSDTYVKLAERSNPAIVNIFTTQDLQLGVGDPLGIFRVPVGGANLQMTSLGTGFFISPDGFMLTNAHVIAKADRIHVFLHDLKGPKEVKVIGVDPLTDLALLKVDCDRNLSFLKMADSDAVAIGAIVVAIGNPFGLDYSLTTGVISAKNRVISPGSRRGLYEDFLQTSAQINPGNSGGPLLNLWGEVVGVNSAIIAGAQGIGFAIPSNLAKALLPDLVRSGRIARSYSGIGLVDLNPSLAKRFEVTETYGAIVVRLNPRGPAAVAGVKHGDIILAVNGKEVKNARELSHIIAVARVGEKLSFSLSRQGKRMTIVFTAVNHK
jgi:serine protease Do